MLNLNSNNNRRQPQQAQPLLANQSRSFVDVDVTTGPPAQVPPVQGLASSHPQFQNQLQARYVQAMQQQAQQSFLLQQQQQQQQRGQQIFSRRHSAPVLVGAAQASRPNLNFVNAVFNASNSGDSNNNVSNMFAQSYNILQQQMMAMSNGGQPSSSSGAAPFTRVSVASSHAGTTGTSTLKRPFSNSDDEEEKAEHQHLRNKRTMMTMMPQQQLSCDPQQPHHISPLNTKRKSLVSLPSPPMLMPPDLLNCSVSSTPTLELQLLQQQQQAQDFSASSESSSEEVEEDDDDDEDYGSRARHRGGRNRSSNGRKTTTVIPKRHQPAVVALQQPSALKERRQSVSSTTSAQGGLGGERRLSIAFTSYGQPTVPAQTFGKYGWKIPDGLAGSHTMYAQRWSYEITHGKCLGYTVLTWRITNLTSNTVVTMTETPQQATMRQQKGNTICNIVLRKALDKRAEELELVIQSGTKNETQIANLRSLIKELQPKQCTEGLLFFGLRHECVQLRANGGGE
jgi:hypothetical protein